MINAFSHILHKYSIEKGLKVFFSWCNEQGYTKTNLKIYKASETVKETYTDDERMTLLRKPESNCNFCEYRKPNPNRTYLLTPAIIEKMIHYMHLQDSPFQKISLGEKTIELRLFTKKRKLITTCDLILFSNLSNPDSTISAELKGLYVFFSFDELYASLPLDRCGYSPDKVKTASPKDMDRYCSPEEQQLHGVVGIGINVVPKLRLAQSLQKELWRLPTADEGRRHCCIYHI